MTRGSPARRRPRPRTRTRTRTRSRQHVTSPWGLLAQRRDKAAKQVAVHFEGKQSHQSVRADQSSILPRKACSPFDRLKKKKNNNNARQMHTEIKLCGFICCCVNKSTALRSPRCLRLRSLGSDVAAPPPDPLRPAPLCDTIQCCAMFSRPIVQHCLPMPVLTRRRAFE